MHLLCCLGQILTKTWRCKINNSWFFYVSQLKYLASGQKNCRHKHHKFFPVSCKFKSFSNIFVCDYVRNSSIFKVHNYVFFAVSIAVFLFWRTVAVFDAQFAIYLPILGIYIYTNEFTQQPIEIRACASISWAAYGSPAPLLLVIIRILSAGCSAYYMYLTRPDISRKFLGLLGRLFYQNAESCCNGQVTNGTFIAIWCCYCLTTLATYWTWLRKNLMQI